jgi:uncharacterized protein YaaN involved in tellurite resistance
VVREADPAEVDHLVTQLLVGIFQKGDVIEHCNEDYRTVDAALDAVQVAQVDWAR